MSVHKGRGLTRHSLSTAAIISAAANASTLYLATVSEQTASNFSLQLAAETIAARHGEETVTYSGDTFPETLRVALEARHLDYVCFFAQPQEVTRALMANAQQMLRQLDSGPYGDAVWGVVTGLTAADESA